MKRLARLLLVFAAAAFVGAAQDDAGPWRAPDEAKTVKNPLEPTAEDVAAGQHLFRLNCQGCHGPKGDGNGAAAPGLPRKPADFTDAMKMIATTDGELFWKITTGRPPMPPWTQLSDAERWQLVSYLRTFAKTR